MTREELIGKAKYIQFPFFGKYKEYDVNCIHKLPYHGACDVYSKWKVNEHHFTTEYHKKHVIPLLCELLELTYNPNDFILIERKHVDFDISFFETYKRI